MSMGSNVTRLHERAVPQSPTGKIVKFDAVFGHIPHQFFVTSVSKHLLVLESFVSFVLSDIAHEEVVPNLPAADGIALESSQAADIERELSGNCLFEKPEACARIASLIKKQRSPSLPGSLSEKNLFPGRGFIVIVSWYSLRRYWRLEGLELGVGPMPSDHLFFPRPRAFNPDPSFAE